MSGFFQCYYYYGKRQEDIGKILSEIGRHGYIFSPKYNWVQFVTDQNTLDLDQKIVEKNTSILIYMMLAEDHGWAYQVFYKSENVSKYECHWDYTVQHKANGSMNWLFQQMKTDMNPILHLLFPKKISNIDLQRICPPEELCRMLRLNSIDSIAYDYINQYPHLYFEKDPGIISI